MTKASSADSAKDAGAAASHDWTATALGPRGAWPHTLRLCADIVLDSPVPMLLAWGAEPVLVFNQAYAELGGMQAPGGNAGTAAPLSACADAFARARAGEPVRAGRQMLAFADSDANPVACDVAMTPIRDEQGAVRGVLCTMASCTLAETAQPKPPALRVLVVEDNIDSQYLVCEMLNAFGHQADGVADGESALAMLRAAPYHVLFSDVSLPGISGVELARQAVVMQPDLRVIFASGYGDMLLRHLDFPYLSMQKPYEMDQLQGALDAIARQVLA